MVGNDEKVGVELVEWSLEERGFGSLLFYIYRRSLACAHLLERIGS